MKRNGGENEKTWAFTSHSSGHSLVSSMGNWQVGLTLMVRSHLSEPEPPAGLATNIHPYLAPPPTRKRIGGETVGYLPRLISHYIISMLFSQSSLGPGHHIPQAWMTYLQEYTSPGLWARQTDWLTLVWDSRRSDDLLIDSSGTPGSPQGHMPPRTKYFLLFNSSYPRLQKSMFSKSPSPL